MTKPSRPSTATVPTSTGTSSSQAPAAVSSAAPRARARRPVRSQATVLAGEASAMQAPSVARLIVRMIAPVGVGRAAGDESPPYLVFAALGRGHTPAGRRDE